MGGSSISTRSWADAWQRAWDRLERHLVPDREPRIRVLVELVEAVAGKAASVLDLACGTGTITCRLLDRLPEARSIAVDVDPVLLTIAEATFADDERVRIARADLRDPAWVDVLPEERVDAVLTATALHWLSEDTVRRLYRDLARLVRPGGLFAHAEHMPLVDLPRLGAALATIDEHRDREQVAGRLEWDAWWEAAAEDPALRAAAEQRRVVFASNYPLEEFSPPADWHSAALLEAGFAEAGVVWRAGAGAVVAAIR